MPSFSNLSVKSKKHWIGIIPVLTLCSYLLDRRKQNFKIYYLTLSTDVVSNLTGDSKHWKSLFTILKTSISSPDNFFPFIQMLFGNSSLLSPALFINQPYYNSASERTGSMVVCTSSEVNQICKLLHDGYQHTFRFFYPSIWGQIPCWHKNGYDSSGLMGLWLISGMELTCCNYKAAKLKETKKLSL